MAYKGYGKRDFVRSVSVVGISLAVLVIALLLIIGNIKKEVKQKVLSSGEFIATKMIEKVKEGKIDVVVVKDLSRIGRNNGRVLVLIDDFKNMQKNLKNLVLQEIYLVLQKEKGKLNLNLMKILLMLYQTILV